MKFLNHCNPPDRPPLNLLLDINGTKVVGPPPALVFNQLLQNGNRQIFQSAEVFVAGEYHYCFIIESNLLANGEYITHLAAALKFYEQEEALTQEIAETLGPGHSLADIEPAHYYLVNHCLPLCSYLYERSSDRREAYRKLAAVHAPTIAHRVDEWINTFQDDYDRSGWYILKYGIRF